MMRKWLVLTILPRAPRRIDTGSIEARLRERGIAVHRRTIQRDLIELAEVFPIVSDEREKPYGWQWGEDADLVGQLPPPRSAVAAFPLDLSLRVRKEALGRVLDRLGPRTHRVTDEGDAHFTTLAVVVDDSREVRCALFDLGDEVEVVSPLGLRSEIAERARRVLAVHAS